MQIVKSIESLRETLPTLVETEETSIGLVIVSAPWGMNAVSLVNRADKLCDVLVLMYLPKEPLEQGVLNLLHNTNVNLVFHPNGIPQTACMVKDVQHNLDVTLLMQTVLAVMPISVFVGEKDLALRGCFASLESTFSTLFTVQTADVGMDLLTKNQRAVKSLAPVLRKALKQGKVADAEVLKALPEGAVCKSLKFLDPKTFSQTPPSFLPILAQIEIEIEKEIVKELIEIKEESWKFWEKP